MKVYLSASKDGRILVQGRVEQKGSIAHLLHYVSQGEQFLGVDFNSFAQQTPGMFEIPEQPSSADVSPDTSQMNPQAQTQPQQ